MFNLKNCYYIHFFNLYRIISKTLQIAPCPLGLDLNITKKKRVMIYKCLDWMECCDLYEGFC